MKLRQLPQLLRLRDAFPLALKFYEIVLEAQAEMVDIPRSEPQWGRSIERRRRLAAYPPQAVLLHLPQVLTETILRAICLTPLAVQ